MLATNTQHHYGKVAVSIHWLTAILVVLLLASGFRAGDMNGDAAKAEILRLHVPFGLTILLLTLARIAWWLFADRKPDSVPMPVWQDRVARSVHILFYLVILGMAVSGTGMMILSGAGPIVFGVATDRLPDFNDYLPRVPHGIGARLLIALFLVHAGAALYHQFIKRDGMLRRMWFGAR